MNHQSFILGPRDFVPNNPRLPVIVYRGVVPKGASDRIAEAFEALFAANGWPPQWRAPIYGFHHYHTKGHEVLGAFNGYARLEIGGPDGPQLDIRAGDALLLPAGTGHRCVRADDLFEVVGAYPPGQEGDICEAAAAADTIRAIGQLTHPPTDPVAGAQGPTAALWTISDPALEPLTRPMP